MSSGRVHRETSPTPRRSTTSGNLTQENVSLGSEKTSTRVESINAMKKSATALSSSVLGNQAPIKKMKTSHVGSSNEDVNPMDKLLKKLTEQSDTITKQADALVITKDSRPTSSKGLVEPLDSLAGSSTAAAEICDAPESKIAQVTNTAGEETKTFTVVDEVLLLKLELEKAKGKIARMDEELTQTRITKHTIEQAIGSSSEADYPHRSSSGGSAEQRLGNTIAVPGRTQFGRDSSWAAQDDARSDTSDAALSAGGFNRARAIWGTSRPKYVSYQGTAPPPMPNFQLPVPSYPTAPWMGERAFTQPFPEPMLSYGTMSNLRGDPSVHEEAHLADRRNGSRNQFGSRGGFPYSSGSQYDGDYSSGPAISSGVAGTMGGLSTGMGSMPYQPQPIGTPLSPFAPEFNSTSSESWKSEAIATEGQTYLPTTEPLNYRRLLERTVNCNWKYIVDKIVCNNDQQASIFLQQKLKVGTTEQKFDIVEAIVSQAYPLMVNRFGNFLVQRCFEHGTPEQVIKIADAIRGNTLNLSMDAFGCHVVQKAFDSVPEDYKAIMVHELLRRIPETVIHRYACHVWQKLFELRWTESPPQIMKYVNDALHTMWHEVALGETGSLVVQNIFENCLEEDKRPCIEEVLASIDIVAHGQFGNWCIQHICEHGAPADRSRAIDHVIRYASEYSMDQFASKVVEKCLKIGGVEFLSRYLDRVCEGRADRPRIPLIDIASDQYGNYLIQYILTHANVQHREVVACHIRKHMVSLRGSKFGSRVGMLCTNPAVATRPGPGSGPAPQMGRLTGSQSGSARYDSRGYR